MALSSLIEERLAGTQVRMHETTPRPSRPSLLPILSSLLLALLLLSFPQPSLSELSGCEICAQTGQCSAAYKSAPGQYCGQFFDQRSSTSRPCCCPLGTYCKVSAFGCMCHVPGNAPSNGGHVSPSIHMSGGKKNVGGFLVLSGLVLCVLCCCLPAVCSSPQRKPFGGEGIPVTVAHAVPSGDGSNPPPTAPGWYGSTGQPQYESYTRDTGTGGAGKFGAAMGGLAAGTILGTMLGGNRVAGGGGGGGGGGGYDIVGDSGDGGGGDGGFDIAGDS